jgi:hypothetical protein
MSFNDASTACRVHLSQMDDLPPVAYENMDYSPVSGQLFLSEKTLFASSTGLLMDGALQRNDFIYQVLVYAPKGVSVHTAQKMADNVATRFARGLRLTRNSVTVEAHKVEVKPPFNSDSWFVIPVDVHCLFFA